MNIAFCGIVCFVYFLLLCRRLHIVYRWIFTCCKSNPAGSMYVLPHPEHLIWWWEVFHHFQWTDLIMSIWGSSTPDPAQGRRGGGVAFILHQILWHCPLNKPSNNTGARPPPRSGWRHRDRLTEIHGMLPALSRYTSDNKVRTTFETECRWLGSWCCQRSLLEWMIDVTVVIS